MVTPETRTLTRVDAVPSKPTRAPCPGTVVVTVAGAPFGVAAAVASAGTSWSVAVAEPVAAACGSTSSVYVPEAGRTSGSTKDLA